MGLYGGAVVLCITCETCYVLFESGDKVGHCRHQGNNITETWSSRKERRDVGYMSKCLIMRIDNKPKQQYPAVAFIMRGV
jgi:hypothetical protein